ncbi:glycine betaine/proline transport system ATP-binding protein [Marinobacter persicus]|uniref:Quaternary amine transport ATP-binding protein n=1 Tax=Marinobacter persicus TaxID=930118 RepID=A0A1I3SZ04_9GAMM|nr:betaine/proline/choline family ABC transporter ATP-binding protein [Marinobacter persicus]GHD40811.1 proline/glycine betaine ABC transporter ATP-binding protein [Marinobacter persicus]SFJ63079.1 glycine betaine/proline transport system ATP-binding protein [Marinobacter persicus]
MTRNVKISIKNLYKIFGPTPDVVLEYARQGMHKAEMLEQHNHVLGLRDINVDIHEGEITVIMGLSGSGKSTLIRHLNRLIDPTAGEVQVDGDDIMTYTEEQLRQLRRERMSMVFQKFALLPHKTVLENAGMAKDIRGYTTEDFEGEARKWLARVGLEGNEQQYPHQLSGGMQQRVGIARALVSDAQIMLMDEAFSALDPLIRSDMQDLLLELQEELKKTIVFITHDLDEALKLADHLVILKEGEVVQQGDPQDILLNPGDPYIVDFISDINRARVLRVRSMMTKPDPEETDYAGDISEKDNLEDVLRKSGGDMTLNFRVMRGDEQVGTLHMKDLARALVPTDASESRGKTAA